MANPPLTFQLRVDPGHEYGQSRGLTKETLEYFGAGFCLSKGMLAGRYIVPLHDGQGCLVGYAGRSIDNKEPKYLFPSGEKKGFHKKFLLFNLHRVIKEISRDGALVVVEGFFDTMKVKQAGYACLGILGSSLSQEQKELLCQHFHRVILMFDGDDSGRVATEDCIRRLVPRLFVKAIYLPEGKQPDQLSSEEIEVLIR